MLLSSVNAFRRQPWAFAAVLAAVLLCANVFFVPAFVEPRYLPGNLGSLSPFVIAAVASTPAILSGRGGIDISIGPLMALLSIVFITVLLPHGMGAPLISIPLLVLLGVAIATISGFAITVLRYQPVIATVCSFFVIGGVALQMVEQPKAAADNWTYDLGQKVGPIPGGLITIAVPLLIWIALGRTSYLRNLYAVGGNDVACYSAGMPVGWIRLLAYSLGGLFAAVGGIALAGATRTADATAVSQYTLVGIAAVALGGTALTGGRGGLLGSVLGAVSIFLIGTLLSSLNIESNWLQVLYGAILLLGVVLGSRRRLVAT